MPEPVLVIEYGRESYVRGPGGYYHDSSLVINGSRDWPKAVGDPSFRVVKGKVTSVSRYVDPEKVVTKYALRPDLLCAPKKEWVRTDEYSHLPDADKSLYSPVYEERTRPAEPLAFEIVDGKAAPRTLPHGIKPKAPGHIDVYSWFWWTLPCEASRAHVFGALTDRVKQLDPHQFSVTVYTNIQHMRVEAHSFSLGGVAYKPEKYLLHIDRESTSVPSFEGANLDDVLAKVSAWCDEKMKAVHAAMTVTHCPCCNTKLKEKPKVRGRDPQRYRVEPKHDIS